jgi:hypothetical protein
VPEIRKDGSAAVNYGVTYFPSSKTGSGAVPVAVQPGEEHRVEIRMLPEPVWHVSGNILGNSRGPHLSVKLQSIWDDSRHGTVSENGAFNFWRVPGGRYRLYAENWNDDKYLQSAPVLIDVDHASVEGIHLTLLPLVDLTGHVRDEDWRQISAEIKEHEREGAAEIRLLPFGLFSVGDYRCKLSDDGGFDINAVAPGRYRVRITKLPKNFYLRSMHFGEREFQDGILEIDGGTVQREMLIELGADGAEVSGIVREAKDVVRGALIILLADKDSFSAVAGAVRSSEDGSYVIHGIAPGKYKLLALSAKYASASLTDEGLELDRNETERIQVRQGDRITQDLNINIR